MNSWSMAIDLIQWMVFCSWRCGRAAGAMSIAVHGSVGLLPTFRNSEPAGSSGGGGRHPLARPLQVARAGSAFVIAAIADTKVVRRRGDDNGNGIGCQGTEHIQAVAKVEAEGAAGV